jgi:hypothetical protein
MKVHKACRQVTVNLDLSAFATLVNLKEAYNLSFAEITNALLTTTSKYQLEEALTELSDAKSKWLDHQYNTKNRTYNFDKSLLIEPDSLNSETLAAILGKGSSYGLVSDEKQYLTI